MDNKEFKKSFCTMAKQYGFKTAFGCCYKESSECLFVMELQKSNYSNLFYLNLKTYVQGVFGKEYLVHKDYLKKYMGNIFNRLTLQYSSIFDLESEMSDENRLEKLDICFYEFIIPYSEKNLSVSGIRELSKSNELKLISTVKDELDRLYPE